MKRYRKKTTKLLQIRFSKDEYEEVNNFIKKFRVTKREFIITACNQLEEYNTIRKGKFRKYGPKKLPNKEKQNYKREATHHQGVSGQVK